MLAGLLGWPQACYASQILLHAKQVPEMALALLDPGWPVCCLKKNRTAQKKIIVTSEVEDGLASKVMALPAIVTCDLRLNTPGPVGLANVMKARNKPIERQEII